MPWEIDDRNCIHKRGEAEPIPGGCHASRADAEAHLRALYASENKERASLSVYKGADGTDRWVLVSSNSFEDRDKEVVSQAALETDVARADDARDYGPLRWWHLKGMDIGDCDFNMLHGRMLVEAGTFRAPGWAEAVKAHADELAVSIAFEHPASEPDHEGVFHHIRRFERSLLPRGYESNRFTSVQLVNKEASMPTEAEKIKAFAEFMRVDETVGRKMLAAAEQAEKAAIAANVRSKAKAEGKDDDELAPDDKPAGTDAAADKPFPKDEAEDDEEPKKGGMEKKEWDLAHKAIAALVEKVEKIEHILTTSASEKAAKDQEIADTLATVKQLAETAQNGVLELKGELPRRLTDPFAAFRASQSGSEPSQAIKQAVARNGQHDAPTSSMEKHFAGIGGVGVTLPPVPQPPTPGK